MQETRAFLRRLGLPTGDAHDLPTSSKRFPDGAQYRVEIPSVEGPAALEAVRQAAREYGVRIHRVSQGSGIMLLRSDEMQAMARLGHEMGIEVSLFVGPRAGWDTGAQFASRSGRNLGARQRGMDQLLYALEDIRRAALLGIRSVLIADEGLLWVAGEMKKAGELPPDFVFKLSVQIGTANPAAAHVMERLGGTTLNTPTDLSLAQLAAIRQATDMPLDVYVEAPDDFGGFVRHYEIAELVRVAAPVYLKFGLRNAPDVYPSGSHLEATVVALSRERVRRASIGLELLQRYYPEATTSELRAPGLGIPEPPAAD
ncbi:U32 family peptidase [Thermogemmatispora carboxidivorans]|uniref:U32 family peptidase n=1 Tax=Thermogemmatispora carboxidivorans TaxID=1382306 RepID=UPI00069ACB1B